MRGQDAFSENKDAFCENRDACWRPGGLALTRRGLALCAFPPGARIADMACGAGASVRLLQEEGYRCVGLDLHAYGGDMHAKGTHADDSNDNATHPDNARARAFPLLRARAEAPPFARESLDGVLCECALSLSKHPEGVLREFAAICRANGRLLLADLYLREAGQSPAAIFSRRELEDCLHAAGWRVVCFEDHSRELKEFAAQLLWHGEGHALLWMPAACGKSVPWRACGYGLWIAQKEEQ